MNLRQVPYHTRFLSETVKAELAIETALPTAFPLHVSTQIA